MWMNWRAPANGVVRFSTHGSGFDTTLAVYRGAVLSSLADSEVARNDDAEGRVTSALQFNAAKGEDYAIAVDGYAADSGTLVLGWSLAVDGESVPEIRRHPEGVLAEAGASVVLSVEAIGRELRYQWYREGVAIAGGDSPSLMLPAISAESAGTYEAGVRNGNGVEIRSEPAFVQVLTASRVEIGFRDKWEDFLVASETSGARARSDLLTVGRGSFASVALGVSGGLAMANSRGARQASDPLLPCALEAEGATLWWRLRPTVSGLLTLDTFGSEVDTVLAVLRDPPSPVPEFLACSDDAIRPEGTSKVEVPVVAGEDYYVQIDSVHGVGRVRLQWLLGGGTVELPITLSIETQGASLRLRAEVNPGRYRWESSSNLTRWDPEEEVAATAREIVLIRAMLPNDTHRYFRVVRLN